MTRDPDRLAETTLTQESERPRPRQLASDALLQGASELEILHGGEVYRLRRTGRGKLLLTK